MQRLWFAAALLVGFLSAHTAHAQYYEYMRVCTTYGAGYYYIPGTEDCYNPDTGETRRETEYGTYFSETALAAQVRELEHQSAISIALEDPDLVAGERFGIRVNWGTTETADAIGLTGAILLGESITGGTRMIGTGGLGLSEDFVGARFGFQLNW